MILYNGFIFEDNIGKYNMQERLKQENQTIKFDTLVSHIDIEIINKALKAKRW